MKVQMIQKDYDGYCIGQGVEYPGIIVSAENGEELARVFKKAIPAYKRGLKHFGITDKRDISIVTIQE